MLPSTINNVAMDMKNQPFSTWRSDYGQHGLDQGRIHKVPWIFPFFGNIGHICIDSFDEQS